MFVVSVPNTHSWIVHNCTLVPHFLHLINILIICPVLLPMSPLSQYRRPKHTVVPYFHSSGALFNICILYSQSVHGCKLTSNLLIYIYIYIYIYVCVCVCVCVYGNTLLSSSILKRRSRSFEIDGLILGKWIKWSNWFGFFCQCWCRSASGLAWVVFFILAVGKERQERHNLEEKSHILVQAVKLWPLTFDTRLYESRGCSPPLLERGYIDLTVAIDSQRINNPMTQYNAEGMLASVR